MAEVVCSSVMVEWLLFQNIEGGTARIVGARFDASKKTVVLDIEGSAIPATPAARTVCRRTDDGVFTRFEPA